MVKPIFIALVTEDVLSMAIAERIVAASDRPFVVSRRFVSGGFGNIKRSVATYRTASRTIPHVVLTDLDRAECPATLRAEWGATNLPDSMLLRVAVRETESWLLGDRDGFSQFASVATSRLPQFPERLDDPKSALIGLVRRSRSRRLAAELVPAQGNAATIGPLYNERLCAFVRNHWSPDAATTACPSLARMRIRLAHFIPER